MPYRTDYNEGRESAFSAPRYSANPVSSNSSPLPYSSAFTTGGGMGSGGMGQPMMSGPSKAGGYSDVSGGSDNGINWGGYMQLFQAIGDKIQARANAQTRAAQAASEVPEDPTWMKPILDQMAAEGMQLRDSKLGPQATAAARTAGARAADQRGLGGPLAASVSAGAELKAQDNYSQWRLQALNAHRMMYMDKVKQYLAAMEARRRGLLARDFASREADWAKVPLGPIGRGIGGLIQSGVGADVAGSDKNIMSKYNYSSAMPTY